MPALLALLIFLVTAITPAAAADSSGKGVKQIDLAKNLIDTLGWSEGLPENPTDKDYRVVLGGKRTFRFEAEEIFDRQNDAVSVRTTPLFGPFSGGGWLQGISSPTAVHFRIFIPISGTYSLKVAAKGNGYLWSIAGRAFRANFGETLNEITVGQVFIPSGYLDFNTLVQPEAGIDYLVFTAPGYAPIEPSAGWDFNAPLTTAALAEVVAATRGDERLLPDDPTFAKKVIEASSLPLPAGAIFTDTQIYGKPSAGKWLRATNMPATVTIPLNLDSPGVYHFRARCRGTEISAAVGTEERTRSAKPYLEWIDLGTFRLGKGSSALVITLPPAAGLDLIEIGRKRSTPADYLVLEKIDGRENGPVTPKELDKVLKALQEQGSERK